MGFFVVQLSHNLSPAPARDNGYRVKILVQRRENRQLTEKHKPRPMSIGKTVYSSQKLLTAVDCGGYNEFRPETM